jgi:plastocyanin
VGVAAAAPAADTAPTEVGANGFKFEPATVTISVGQTVHWKGDGAHPHTVTFDDGSFRSGDPTDTLDTSRTFHTAGTFTYYCEVHRVLGMTGTVVVRSADGSTPTPTPTPTAAPKPTISGLQLKTVASHGKVKGSFTASPAGAHVTVAATAGGDPVGSTNVDAKKRTTRFSLALDKASRKALNAEGTLRLKVKATVRSAGQHATARTTVTVGLQ